MCRIFGKKIKIDMTKASKTYWLFPYNPHIYSVEQCLQELKRIHWHLSPAADNNRLNVGDYVLMYEGYEARSIRFLTRVEKVGILMSDLPNDEDKFWINIKDKKETEIKYKHCCLLRLVKKLDQVGLSYSEIPNIIVRWQNLLKGDARDYILGIIKNN